MVCLYSLPIPGRTKSTHKMAVRIFKLPQIPTTSATIVVPVRLTAATSSTQTTFTTFHSSTTPVASLERAIAGGWQISGVTVAETGPTLLGGGSSLTYNGPDVIGLGGNTTNRPNLVAPVSYPHQQKAWFTKSSFAAPAAPWTAAGAGGTGFGNANKDAVDRSRAL